MAEELKKPTPAKKAVKPKLVRIAALKELPTPKETPGGTQFLLTVVTATFKQEDWPCTQTVYNWARATKPAYKVHVEWVLTIDPTTNLVTHVTETPKPTSIPGFKQVDEGKETTKFVVISLFPDGSSAVTGIPERVTEDVSSEIQTAVTDSEEPIHTGMKIGRFIVMERREVPGSTEIHVDPMPR